MFDSLSNPDVLFTLAAILATTVALTLAVNKTLTTPARRRQFNDSLSMVMSSELDIDTTLGDAAPTKMGWFQRWNHLAVMAGRSTPDPKSTGRFAAGAVVAGAAFGFAVIPGGLFGGVAVGIAAMVCFRAWLMLEAKKRTGAMEKQLPQLLSSLSANLQAGTTPQQALQAVADDFANPLGEELRILKRDLNVNVTLEQALLGLATRVPSREMQFLVASVDIAVQSGSDLLPQLGVIKEIVIQRTRIRNKVRAAVAQSKPTAWLAYAAVPGMLAMSFRPPENRDFWLGPGFVWLVIIGVLYTLGYVVMRGMVRSVENA